MLRKTYAVIDGDILRNNTKEIIKEYQDYDYYFGVVKNNAYHHGMKCVLDLIKGGINYLAVSSLEEAIQVRKYTHDTPVLCLEPISLDNIDDAINASITLTVDSLAYLQELIKNDLYAPLKIHIAIDSGMNRLGIKTNEEFNEAIKIIRQFKKLDLEGIYTHFATSGTCDPYWDKQLKTFQEITKNIDLSTIKIVHLGRSLTLVNHPKIPFANGIRLGIILYGFSQSRKKVKGLKNKLRELKINYLKKKYNCSETFSENNLKLKTAMSLYSQVISSREVQENDVIGYNTYKIPEKGFIATIPIGYADGVTKEFQTVYINGNYCQIVSDSMDMIMVYSKEKIKIGEKVEIFGNHISVSDVCRKTNMNAYHLFNQISHRITRVHSTKEGREEIQY